MFLLFIHLKNLNSSPQHTYSEALVSSQMSELSPFRSMFALFISFACRALQCSMALLKWMNIRTRVQPTSMLLVTSAERPCLLQVRHETGFRWRCTGSHVQDVLIPPFGEVLRVISSPECSTKDVEAWFFPGRSSNVYSEGPWFFARVPALLIVVY